MAAIARFNEDTRFARRASRESDELNGILTRGSPLGIGQPRADGLDTFGVVSMPHCRLCLLFRLESADEAQETFGLGAEAGEQFGVRQAALSIEDIIDSVEKYALGKDVSVAVAEDALELFDGPQRTPNARRYAGETHGAMLEAFREFQHINEIFKHAGHPTVVFGRDDVQAGRF